MSPRWLYWPIVLEQGTGFTSPTVQPAALGTWTNANFDGKPMAHWDTVQWSEIPESGDFFVCVTAFHKHGIDRVEFSLDNGPWVSVFGDFQTNPCTGVDGFIVEIPTSGLDFNLAGSSSADGSVEVRAVVYPNTAGTPRVLEPLILSKPISDRVVYVNAESGSTLGSGTTADPYLTIYDAVKKYASGNSADCRGLKVRLQSVSDVSAFPYELETLFQGTVVTGNSWLTIEADEGLTNGDIHVRHPIGLNTLNADKIARIAQAEHVRYRNVTIKETRLYTSLGSDQWIWCDGCHWAGSYGDDPDFLAGISLNINAGDNYTWSRTDFRDIGGERRAFVTECTQTGGFQFAKDVQLCRNCNVTGIFEDATEGHKFCVNFSTSEVYDDIDLCTTDYHADMVTVAEYGSPADLATWESLENVIIFNYNAQRFDGQGIFLARSNSLSNMAFVNFLWTRPDNNSNWFNFVGSQPACVGGPGSGITGPPDNSTCKPWGNDSNGIQMIGIRSLADGATFGTDHIIFQNCLLSDIVNNRLGNAYDIGGGVTIDTGPATNVVLDQCIVWEFYNETGNTADIAGWTGSNNHVLRFANSSEGEAARGSKFFELTNTTYGDPIFKNTSNDLVYADFTTDGTSGTTGWGYGTEDDFRPGIGSPLLVGVNNRGVVRDITGRRWVGQQPIGPLAP